MYTTLLIIIIIIFIAAGLTLYFLSGMIFSWGKQKMRDKTEDFIREQMGMPSRKAQREAERKRRKAERKNGYTYTAAKKQPRPRGNEPLIPREYAEDVEFTEFKEYSSSTTVTEETDPQTGRKTVTIESQVEDAVFTEVKKLK